MVCLQGRSGAWSQSCGLWIGGRRTIRRLSLLPGFPLWVSLFGIPGRVPLLGRFSRGLAQLLTGVIGRNPKAAGILEIGGTYPGAYLLRRGLFMPWELTRVLDRETIEAGWRRLELWDRISSELRPSPASSFARDPPRSNFLFTCEISYFATPTGRAWPMASRSVFRWLIACFYLRRLLSLAPRALYWEKRRSLPLLLRHFRACASSTEIRVHDPRCDMAAGQHHAVFLFHACRAGANLPLGEAMGAYCHGSLRRNKGSFLACPRSRN